MFRQHLTPKLTKHACRALQKFQYPHRQDNLLVKASVHLFTRLFLRRSPDTHIISCRRLWRGNRTSCPSELPLVSQIMSPVTTLDPSYITIHSESQRLVGDRQMTSDCGISLNQGSEGGALHYVFFHQTFKTGSLLAVQPAD